MVPDASSPSRPSSMSSPSSPSSGRSSRSPVERPEWTFGEVTANTRPFSPASTMVKGSAATSIFSKDETTVDKEKAEAEATAAAAQEPEQPYHVFGKREKWLCVANIGAAGLFSGLSSNIYFPALDQVAQDLNVSMGSVNLTITSYLIVQGISPVIWGPLSDAAGRRPIYMASFITYIIANIALSFSPNFAVLLLFRGLQSAGSASTVSIGNGVIQDISPPSERGGYISFYQAIRNFSIAVGPVLGGVLSQYLGFRAIFVFLLILSSLTLGVLIVFLPETMRSIAGNGSTPLEGVYKPLVRYLRPAPAYMQTPEEAAAAAAANPSKKAKITLMTFLEPLKLLGEKDILCNLVFGGVVYAIWSMATSSTTSLFKARFGLNELQVGLAYLPNGLGTIVGSTIVGKLMGRDWRATEARYKEQHGMAPDAKLSSKSVPADFPVEHARLRHLPWIAALFALATAGYGLSLAFPAVTDRPGWIAVPLLLSFLVAGTSNAVFALNQTLVADLCPGKGAGATAINNLVRCSLGAVGVALVDSMIGAMGPAVAFVVLALITVLCAPLVVINWYWGQTWRGQRIARLEAAERERNGLAKA